MASYIAPNIRPRFDSLSPELQNEILKQDLKIYTLRDLIHCLEKITIDN